jgi:hypothetical protein
LGAARAEALRGAGGQAPNLKVIWGTMPVDVKEFLDETRNRIYKNQNEPAKNRRKQVRTHE